ncbi:MAG: hypothetical protein EBR23_07090 [Planctomycetia bacterium]|nr:hypothetical protein [Planctomycetia bacterium]
MASTLNELRDSRNRLALEMRAIVEDQANWDAQAESRFDALDKDLTSLDRRIDALAKADAGGLLSALVRDGQATLSLAGGGTAVIDKDDVLVRTTAKPGWAAAEGPRAVVVVAAELTPALVAEGLVNEAVHAVQSLRKKLDLEFTDRIDLTFVTESTSLQAAIEAHLERVASETLAATVTFTPVAGGTAEDFDIDGHTCSITIRTAASHG